MDRKVIMIVDDDPDDINLFIDAIEEIYPEATCIKAKHGMDALRQLNQNDIVPDYIFLDLNMPRMNGLDCLGEIKKSVRLKNIPVVIYSTSRNETDIIETKRLGAAFFLTKPTSYMDLNEALSIIIFDKAIQDSNLSHKVLVAF
jgi:CheY-like chemotaxis protein